jgi:hypothetical protein
MALDGAVHPPFEQDQRHDDRIEIKRREVATPDLIHHVGCEEVNDPHSGPQQNSRGYQHLDTQQVGRHHLLRQRALEVVRHRRLLLAFHLARELHALFLCHSGMVRRTRPGISRFRVRLFEAPRNDCK